MSWFKSGKPAPDAARGAGGDVGRGAGRDADPRDADARGADPEGADPEGGSTLERGLRAEDRARRYLEARGMQLLAEHYRVARGPSRPAGEVDLVMRDRDGTLVFVEVRSRRDATFGGAAASVGAVKQRRIIRAAQHYLRRLPALPPCRFDVVAIDAGRIEWIQAAFDAS